MKINKQWPANPRDSNVDSLARGLQGLLNARRVLNHRAGLLERLYDNEDPALIRV
jgi:hypothetical protein